MSRVAELEALLHRAYTYIETQGVFDPPGSESVTLRHAIARVLDSERERIPKCKSTDCWICHGIPANAGPR
jgi:hypothetical protein